MVERCITRRAAIVGAGGLMIACLGACTIDLREERAGDAGASASTFGRDAPAINEGSAGSVPGESLDVSASDFAAHDPLPEYTAADPARGPGAVVPSRVPGFAVYREECAPDDPACDYREQRDDGETVCYKLRGMYRPGQPSSADMTVAEPFGMQVVGADDEWDAACMAASDCAVYYLRVGDGHRGTEQGERQMRFVGGEAGVALFGFLQEELDGYDAENKSQYEGPEQLRVSFADGVGTNEAAEIVYSMGCAWQHTPTLANFDDLAGTEYADRFDTHPNYAMVYAPEGADKQELAGRFLALPQVESCEVARAPLLADDLDAESRE